MARMTVTITTPDHPEPRQFHLEEAKAKRFALRVCAEGGTAKVRPFTPSADLLAMLRKAGVNPATVC